MTEIYHRTVLKAISPKSMCWQGYALLKILREAISFFLASGGCRPVLLFLAL